MSRTDAHTQPPSVDPRAVARGDGIERHQSPWLHEEVARRMIARLDWVRQKPSAWWHWQPGSGGYEGHRALTSHYPAARCWWTDVSAVRSVTEDHLRLGLWARLKGMAVQEGTPPDETVDLVWANMSLHRTADPLGCLRSWAAALDTGGMLMFSCLGPDTLGELRGIYREQGWGPPAQVFTDMHDWGDLALQAGFAEPIVDMERIRLSWTSATAMEMELRDLGRNLHPERSAVTRTPAWREYWRRLMEERLRGPDGRLSLSFEIIYGHAIKAPPRVRALAQTDVGLDQMRAMLSRKPNRV